MHAALKQIAGRDDVAEKGITQIQMQAGLQTVVDGGSSVKETIYLSMRDDAMPAVQTNDSFQ